jgi:CheY-like chemotaxis protein
MNVAGAFRRRVLVVDDDPLIREVMTTVLTYSGYSVETAENGQQALERVGADATSVVLMDLQMPVMDGLTFLWVARRKGIQVPIVFVTGEEGGAGLAEAVGADGFVHKPFQSSVLLAMVERFCGQAA